LYDYFEALGLAVSRYLEELCSGQMGFSPFGLDVMRGQRCMPGLIIK
jgi:hypothetical protein